MKLKLKPNSTYFGDGVVQSKVDTVAIISDYPPSPHQTTPPPQSDVGEHAHTSIQLSHAPTLTTLNICVDLVGKPMGRYTHLLPQPPSLHSADPLDCIVLCSSVLDSTPIVNEDQTIDEV